MSVKLGPMFKWFGSKWQSAKRYPNPEHSLLIEPFAGGAGYALNHSERQVVIWEENANLYNLWYWLINIATPGDIRDIPVELNEGLDIRQLGLSFGQNLLLKHWQRTNNFGECWTISPWGNKPGQWTANTRARVADEVGGVKHWKLSDPIMYLDEPATWFIDPPYQFNYRYGFKAFDYAALDSMVQTITRGSLVIACEAVCKDTGKIPDYLPFVQSHESVTSRRKTEQSHHSKECTYIRRPI